MYEVTDTAEAVEAKQATRDAVESEQAPRDRARRQPAEDRQAAETSDAQGYARANGSTHYKMNIEDLSVWYSDTQALFGLNMDIYENEVTALIGPSGCGKSTFLRCLNRMNDLIEDVTIQGKVVLDGQNIYDRSVDVVELRTHVGMVFQKPNPFPKSIYDNIAYAPKLLGYVNGRRETDDLVERSLKRAGLWAEVSDRLDLPGLSLSGGQQQRLCIARAIAVDPSVLLMDEPCSSLDPVATAKVEQLIDDLKNDYTIVIVTHNLQQAARVAGYTAFFHLGEIIEYDETETLFTHPGEKRTEDYITGRYG